MKKLIKLMFFLMSLIWLGACDDNHSEIDYNPDVLSSKDFIRGEDAVFEIVNAFLKGINDTLVINNGYGYIDACDVSHNGNDDFIKYAYGTVDRMCQDGKFRRGTFYAYFSGEIFAEGVTANIVTDSLFVDDLSVNAIIDIQNLGMNNDNLPEYSLKVISSLIMLPDTNKVNGVSITTNYTMTWAEGSFTPAIHEDDLFRVTGAASGLSADGYQFSVDVLDPLFNYVDCFWISQGLSRITVPVGEIPTGEIDYLIEDGCSNEIHFFFNDNLFYDFLE